MPPCASSKPALDFRVLVGRVVADHHVNVQVLGDIPVDSLENAQVPLMSVPLLALRHHLATGDIG
jgi:hypothetical protein